MGIEYNLSETVGMEQLQKLKLELAPRHQCRNYVQENGGKTQLIEKSEFDSFFDRKEFADGPFRETFGDNYGEPYNPNRQAFGKLKDGRIVYCQLSKNYEERVRELLKLADRCEK